MSERRRGLDHGGRPGAVHAADSALGVTDGSLTEGLCTGMWAESKGTHED